MIISLEELGLAYRKAKVDLYYSSHVSLEAIASYEESLHTNLTVLQEKKYKVTTNHGWKRMSSLATGFWPPNL